MNASDIKPGDHVWAHVSDRPIPGTPVLVREFAVVDVDGKFIRAIPSVRPIRDISDFYADDLFPDEASCTAHAAETNEEILRDWFTIMAMNRKSDNDRLTTLQAAIAQQRPWKKVMP